MVEHDEMADMPAEPGTTFLPQVELTREDEAEQAERMGGWRRGAEVDVPEIGSRPARPNRPLDPPIRTLGPVVDLLPEQRGPQP